MFNEKKSMAILYLHTIADTCSNADMHWLLRKKQEFLDKVSRTVGFARQCGCTQDLISQKDYEIWRSDRDMEEADRLEEHIFGVVKRERRAKAIERARREKDRYERKRAAQEWREYELQ